MYRCAQCELDHPRKNVQIDHIIPTIDIEKGFTTWDEYITRMFCEKESFQILCRECHDSKTRMEKTLRKLIRAQKKLDEKERKRIEKEEIDIEEINESVEELDISNE